MREAGSPTDLAVLSWRHSTGTALGSGGSAGPYLGIIILREQPVQSELPEETARESGRLTKVLCWCPNFVRCGSVLIIDRSSCAGMWTVPSTGLHVLSIIAFMLLSYTLQIWSGWACLYPVHNALNMPRVSVAHHSCKYAAGLCLMCT